MDKWENGIMGNLVLRGKNYYISYADIKNNADIRALGKMCNIKESRNGIETALCYDNKFYILNGDFRKEYEGCMCAEDCMEVYKKNIKHRSEWSTD